MYVLGEELAPIYFGFYPSYVNALMYVYTYIQIKTVQSMQFIGKDTNTGFDSLS